jgi:hypothetical protein
MKKISFCLYLFIAALPFTITGCSDPVYEPDTVRFIYRISLNEGRECTFYAPVPDREFVDPVFIHPASQRVILRNEGNEPTGPLAVRLAGADEDKSLFTVSPDSIPSLDPGDAAAITIHIAGIVLKEPHVYRVTLLAGGEKTSAKLPVSYTLFTFIQDSGAAITPSSGAAQFKAGASSDITITGKGSQPWFSSDSAVAALTPDSADQTKGSLSLAAAGEAVLGYIQSWNNDIPTVTGATITVYPADWTPSVNIATSAATVNATSALASYAAAKAVDGSLSSGKWNTRWGTAADTLACDLTLTFTNPVKAGSFKLFAYGDSNGPSSGRINRFKIQYQDTGGAWQDGFTYYGPAPIPGSSDGSRSYHFTYNLDKPVSAQAFRLRILAAEAAPSIWEFELWNNPLEFMQ